MVEISNTAMKAWNGEYKYAICDSPVSVIGGAYYLCDDPLYSEKLAILRGDELFTIFSRKGNGWFGEDFKEYKKRHCDNAAGIR